MEQLTQLVELTEKFVELIKGNRKAGRRFDRVWDSPSENLYFVEKATHLIYGAKSSFQYNPRRLYCTLSQIDQIDWYTGTPKPGTEVAQAWADREATYKKSYKKRGRPRKTPAPAAPKGAKPQAAAV